MQADSHFISFAGSLGSNIKDLIRAIFEAPHDPTVILANDRNHDTGDRLRELKNREREMRPYRDGPQRPKEEREQLDQVRLGEIIAAHLAQQPKTRRKSSPAIAVLSPYFKLIFLTVVVITVVAGGLHIFLAELWPNPTANQQSAFEAMGLAWKLGFGAIFGLLGGKVT